MVYTDRAWCVHGARSVRSMHGAIEYKIRERNWLDILSDQS